jgi:outer membrane protein OmpA-like peptidoglycan-associated protein
MNYRYEKAIALAVTVVSLAVLGFILVNRSTDGSDQVVGSPSDAATASVDPNDSTPTSALARSTADQRSTTTTEPAPSTSTTEAVPSTSTAEAAPSTATTDVPPAAVTSEPVRTDTSVSTAGETSLDYPTNPDGTPLPLVVIFDTETVTIAGQVPSQAAKDRLAALAIANSRFPDVALVDNMVINPAVPISVGVRVIELNSARFPEGSAEILPEHARELDRVVAIMQALPNISAVVIGHADQRGDDVRNFAISDERARAVVNYLIYLGVSPTRLSSRAAGESDLLTIADDDAALALNRRTEFVFYGLLVE